MRRRVFFFILLLGLAFSATGTTTFTSTAGTYRGATETGSPVSIYLATAVNSALDATPNKAAYLPGEVATLTLVKSGVWAYSGSFSATSSAPAGAGSTTSPDNTNVPVNFDSATYDSLNSYYTAGCAYWSSEAAGIKYSCVNDAGGYCHPPGGLSSACNYNPFGGKTTGERTTTYYRYTYDSFPANGRYAAICKGGIYVNGAYAGNIENTNSVNVQIPSTASGNYTVNIDMTYNCFFALTRLYTGSSSIFPIYPASATITVRETKNLGINCTERVNITIDSITNPVNLSSQTNGQAQVSITIRNNGNVSATVTSIAPSIGSYSGLSPSLPITLQPNQAVTVSGTYTYPGTLTGPTTVRFTVTATGTECGTPVTRTAFRDVTVNPPMCSENVGLTIDSIIPNPINLPTGAPGSTATVTLAVRNTGTNTVNITNVGVTPPDTFSKTSPGGAYPLILPGGSTMNIVGTYTYNGVQLSFGQSVSRTFTVSGAGALCGTPLSAPIGATVQRPACNETASISLTATNPITLNSTNQSSVTLTVTNTGNVAVTIPSAASITVNRGTFVPSSSFPITINPGASANINGVYTYNGATPTTVTFTVTASATECGTPVTRSASYTSNINRPACNETVAISAVATNPITLNFTNQSAAGVSVTNTGNMPVTISSVAVNRGTFAVSTPLPLTINPGATATINGVYSYNGATPTTVTFTVTGNGTECGTPVIRTASYTSNVNKAACNETAAISLSATNPITLNSTNQSQVTLTVTNTGNAAVTIPNAASITTNRGTFVPSGPFPITINPGLSVNINGVYSYNGATPANVTFTVGGSATVCASPATVSANYTSSINSCSYAGIEIVGVMPPAIVFDNRSADIEITVRNNGSAAMNVTAFNVSGTRFRLTIDDALPVLMNAGEVYVFSATLEYTGSDEPPDSVTIRVFATTRLPVCGANTANASITVPIPAKGDLEPEISPATTAMNQTEFSSANITVRNRGAGNITESTILMVRIMHCSAMFMGSCQIESEDNYTIGAPLDEGENETIVSADYQCEGYRYVGIRATANAEGLPVEDNFANNNDTAFIPCSRERCEVSGPDEMRLPGEYRFNVSCFDSDGNEQNCTSGFVVVPPGFRWNYALFPAGAITCSPASCIPVTEGDANENSSIYVSNILMNGTLSVTAIGTTELYHQEINCTAYVQIYPNPCRRQI